MHLSTDPEIGVQDVRTIFLSAPSWDCHPSRPRPLFRGVARSNPADVLDRYNGLPERDQDYEFGNDRRGHQTAARSENVSGSNAANADPERGGQSEAGRFDCSRQVCREVNILPNKSNSSSNQRFLLSGELSIPSFPNPSVSIRLPSPTLCSSTAAPWVQAPQTPLTSPPLPTPVLGIK